MSGKLLIVEKLPTSDGKLRDELIERVAEIADDVEKNEPGCTKYAVFVPREDDGKTVWVVKEYTDQAACDLYLNSQNVKDIKSWLETLPVFTEDDPPVIHELQYISSDFEFSRPGARTAAAPHVIFAELHYVPGGVATSTPYWKAVVDTGRDNEPGTLAYGILRDLSKEEKLASLEVYESPEYLKDVHVPSDAIAQSIKNTKHLRTGLKHNILKKVAGYLYK